LNSAVLGKALLGVLVWLAVAAFAVVAAANWDPLWGFFPVLGAVFLAWAIGEYVVRREAGGRS
jgi:hypothetical protein